MCICRKIFDAHLSVLIAFFAFVISFLHEAEKKEYSEEILSSLFSSTTFSLLKRDIFRTGQSSPENKQLAVRETRFPSISPLVSHFSVIRPCRPFVSSQISGLLCRLAMGKTCSSASCSGRFRKRRVSPVASFAFRGKNFLEREVQNERRRRRRHSRSQIHVGALLGAFLFCRLLPSRTVFQCVFGRGGGHETRFGEGSLLFAPVLNRQDFKPQRKDRLWQGKK